MAVYLESNKRRRTTSRKKILYSCRFCGPDLSSEGIHCEGLEDAWPILPLKTQLEDACGKLQTQGISPLLLTRGFTRAWFCFYLVKKPCSLRRTYLDTEFK